VLSGDAIPAGSIRLEGIKKTYAGSSVPAIDGVDLEVEPGSFFAVLGPSGCGKTTMLRIIAGFEHPTEGRVYIGERDVTSLSPRNRDIAMVFQDYALYPHMTVEQNIGFNLRNRRVPKREVQQRVRETTEMLGIAHLQRKKPAQLSGGERQRVALGRALIRRPRVFLMDEPLSNLDLKLREAMRIELGRLHQELGITTMYVTHDQAEAMTLSTRLAVMHGGRLQQLGPPDEVYARPRNTFVARFIGSPSMNLFRMKNEGGVLRGIEHHEACLPLPLSREIPDRAEVLVGVRPHDLRVAANGKGIPIIVDFTEHLGRNNYVICESRDTRAYLHDQETIQMETPAGVVYQSGVELVLTADPEKIRVFGLDGGSLEHADSVAPVGLTPPSEASVPAA
jgi:multiple sugar transport system ATP-binding protein